jgi:glycosyltransferase involved in cell wall biosynthesis
MKIKMKMKMKMKMKILITHELFMPDFSGGGEKLVYEMAKHLQKVGHEIKVLTTGDPKITSFEGIETIRLPINRYFMNLAIFPIIKAAKWADVIQTSTYNSCLPSWLAGKILRKPVVCLIMSYWNKRWQEMRPGIKGIISKFFEKVQTHRTYDKKIFLSDFSKDFAINYGMSDKNTTIINPGVDIKDYIPKKKRNFVLFSGRFAKQKGVYDVLEVAKKLPNIKFILMGWGEEEKEMRKLATKNVKFLNYSLKDGKRFFEMYGKAPIFFLPSYGETFGFVLVEAMASGCAIVSTIPLGYEGTVIKVSNIDMMTKKIQYYFDHPKETLELGKKNVELAKKFNWENFTKQLVNVYEQVLNKET